MTLSCRATTVGLFIVASFLVWALISFQGLGFDSQLDDRRLQTETISGVSVHSYSSDGPLGRRLRQDQEKDWVIVLDESHAKDKKSETSRRICKAGGKCRSSNARFAVVRATKKELKQLLKTHGKQVAFVEEDAPMFIEPEIPTPVKKAAARAPGVWSWGLDRIDDHQVRLDNHYDALYTGAGAHVYVMDTGIRTTHEAFVVGRAIPTLEVSGHHDEPDGIKVCDGDVTCANDFHGHGTHCAGTVGGRNFGVAPAATLHAVKIFKDCAECASGLEGKWSWFVEALDWVVARGERPAVVSASLSGPSHGGSFFVQMAVRQAVEAGVTVVVSAGNHNRNACNYDPASFSEAITVGATDWEDARSTGWGEDGTLGSNFGSCVDLFAPGSGITSAGIASDTSQSILSGTSMSAPHVAGAAALLLHKKAWLTPKEVRSTLKLEATSGVVTDRKGAPDYLLYVGREPCAFSPQQNTAVKRQGTGGEKLKRSDYGSDLEYLNACSIACREDSTCKGFVDDPTDRRGRMCKPKTASSGYGRQGKTFHVKGDEWC